MLPGHNWHVLCTHTYMQSHQAGMRDMCFKITSNEQLVLYADVLLQQKKKYRVLCSDELTTWRNPHMLTTRKGNNGLEIFQNTYWGGWKTQDRAKMHLTTKGNILVRLVQKAVQGKEHRQEIRKVSSLGDARSWQRATFWSDFTLTSIAWAYPRIKSLSLDKLKGNSATLANIPLKL